MEEKQIKGFYAFYKISPLRYVSQKLCAGDRNGESMVDFVSVSPAFAVAFPPAIAYHPDQ
jgi:hypothetical protein